MGAPCPSELPSERPRCEAFWLLSQLCRSSPLHKLNMAVVVEAAATAVGEDTLVVDISAADMQEAGTLAATQEAMA